MKLYVVALLSLITFCCQAQFRSRRDSTSTFAKPANKNIYVGASDNIVVATSLSGMTFAEREITSLESRETEALKKRDYIALSGLWAKDFSGEDVSTNQVVASSNSLPYYMELSRIIENVHGTDSTMFTRGKEHFRLLGSGSEKTVSQERNFSHVWSKRNGIWKLTSKVHSKE